MPRFHFKQQRRLRGLDKYGGHGCGGQPPIVNGHLTDSASSQKLLEQTHLENGNFDLGMFGKITHANNKQ
jgi:hypothetical protein